MAKKEKEKTTKSKSKSKSTKESNIQLTFAPIAMGAKQYVMRLRDKNVEIVNGEKVTTYVPLIKGLPMKVIVRVGEVLTVTESQYKQLQELGYVEDDESYNKRKSFIESLEPQHPKKPTWDAVSNESESKYYLTLRDSERKVYNDKLIRL